MNILKSLPSPGKISKDAYKSEISLLELKLGALQRRIISAEIPVMIVFEGWDAAGKGTLISKLMMSFDPRGYDVHSILKASEDEAFRPFLWRFWTKTPEKGRIAIFDRSWYRRVSTERVDKAVRKDEWKNAYGDINTFEKQLSDGGGIIVKFFLHITKKEQKRRFKKLRGNSATSWRVAREDMKHHRQYGKYLKAYDEMIKKTDTEYASWTIVDSSSQKAASLKIFRTIARVFEKTLSSAENSNPDKCRPAPSTYGKKILEGVDRNRILQKDEYLTRLDDCQRRIRDIEHEIYRKRIPVLILYEGRDAAGKGGNIRRLVQPMDPRGYEVVPIAAPSDIEKRHHYLWRFWNRLPKAGHMAIFDRTWYGRVLVERVEGFCSEKEWRRSYGEINCMEKHIAGSGAVIIKFWLHISNDEQLKRFKERQSTPWKQWKITDEDWRNRDKWNLYSAAVDEMIDRTSTSHAPWTIIESNCKWFARIKAIETVIGAVEKAL
ncbi:MAG: hypothetical protein WAX69_04260 [Victivallales bacterium]